MRLLGRMKTPLLPLSRLLVEEIPRCAEFSLGAATILCYLTSSSIPTPSHVSTFLTAG